MELLSPSGGLLFSTLANNYLTATIDFVGFSEVESVEWVLTETGNTPPGTEGRNITISEAGLALNVNYHNRIKLFPIEKLVYLTKDLKRHTVKLWDEIPPMKTSPDVIEAHFSSYNLCTWTLDVTVVGKGLAPMFPEQEAEGSYDLEVYCNYNQNRDILIDEVKRRY